MTQSYTRDSLGRLAGASTMLAGGGTLNGVNYQFDNLDRRFEADLADGTKWSYGYNDRSEVTSGKKQLPSGTYAGGQQFEYGFDDIGNRTVARFGGDQIGAGLRPANYSANAMNQLTMRDVPTSVWLTGEAPTNLTLQGVADGRAFAIQRQDGQSFFGEATVDNSQSAVFARVTVVGKTNNVLTDVETGHHLVPKNPEGLTYDDDGNLTTDGRWTYAWDAENRLVSVTARADIPDAAKRKVNFVYDYMSRRIQKTVSTWNGSVYVAQNTNKFVYEGWNLIGTLSADSQLLSSYVWGLDLSGQGSLLGGVAGGLQGAGGVGGLLSMTVHSGPSAGTYFYSYDGNGNVLACANATDGSTAAQYEYGPFGEVIRESGSMAKTNPFRFSTKYQDDESDLLSYGFRYYNPSTGRWLSRDPIGEEGGLNVYGMVGNDSVNHFDLLGLDRNTVSNPTCDCGSGPKLGTSTKTLRDFRWHVWARQWQEKTIQIFIPGTGFPIIHPFHIPFSGGYWVIFGGWVVVDAKCGVPENGWTLSEFVITDWPLIGPNMKPSVVCIYTCTYDTKRTATLPGEGSMSVPPIQREASASPKMPPPRPPFW